LRIVVPAQEQVIGNVLHKMGERVASVQTVSPKPLANPDRVYGQRDRAIESFNAHAKRLAQTKPQLGVCPLAEIEKEGREFGRDEKESGRSIVSMSRIKVLTQRTLMLA
jgi:hypothetical protein